MPELPDVEVYRRRLARRGLRHRITSARLLDTRLLQGISATALERRLKGRTLTSTRRHGKYLFAELSNRDGWLVLHFGMTGDLQVQSQRDELPDHLRLCLDLDGGRRIVYTDIRRFGRIALATSIDAYVEARRLGPDPLESRVDLETFRERLRARASPVKAALMDQSVLAGLGNIYVDEVLFQARMHPRARADRLGDREMKAMYTAMHRVLKKAITAGADPIGCRGASCCASGTKVAGARGAGGRCGALRSAAGRRTTVGRTRKLEGRRSKSGSNCRSHTPGMLRARAAIPSGPFGRGRSRTLFVVRAVRQPRGLDAHRARRERPGAERSSQYSTWIGSIVLSIPATSPAGSPRERMLENCAPHRSRRDLVALRSSADVRPRHLEDSGRAIVARSSRTESR